MNKENIQDLYCIGSGILISFGIAFSVSSVIRVVLMGQNALYILGIFFGGLLIGVGLLPFKNRKLFIDVS